MDYEALKADDAALGSNPDLNAAAAALRALTVTATVPVDTHDIIVELLRGQVYSKLVVLAADTNPASTQRQIADLAINALGLLTEVSVITADDTGNHDWQTVLAVLNTFVSASVIPQAVVDAITAHRTAVSPKYLTVDAGAVQTARSMP